MEANEVMDQFWEEKKRQHDEEFKELKDAVNKTIMKGEGLFAVLGLDYMGGN